MLIAAIKRRMREISAQTMARPRKTSETMLVFRAAAVPILCRHPERSAAQSKDPVEVTLKFSRRDPSVRAGLAFSLGMTGLHNPFAETLVFSGEQLLGQIVGSFVDVFGRAGEMMIDSRFGRATKVIRNRENFISGLA